MKKYPTLEKLLKEKSILRSDLASCLGVRYATVSDKLNGKFSFSYDEAEKIKTVFFPEYPIEELFESRKDG